MSQDLVCIEVGRAKTSDKVSFAQLVAPIQADVAELTWLVSGDVLMGESPDGDVLSEQQIDELIIRRSGDWMLMSPMLVERFAKFIGNDWCHLLGLHETSDVGEALAPNRATVEEIPQIYFRCVDAAYWLVFSRTESLLKEIADECSSSRFVPVNEVEHLSHVIRG